MDLRARLTKEVEAMKIASVTANGLAKFFKERENGTLGLSLYNYNKGAADALSKTARILATILEGADYQTRFTNTLP